MKELMKLKTAFAEPGMILGKDAYSASDHLVAPKDAVLTDRMIIFFYFFVIFTIFSIANYILFLLFTEVLL